MFGIGTQELLIVLVIVMVLFCASRLPGLGKGLGEGLRSFKDGLKGDDKKKPSDLDKPSSTPDESA